jgi:hypothetical protein
MIIDCGGCAERADECRGCLVKTLFETPDGIGDLMAGELRAIEMFELAGFEIELLETPAPPVVVRMLPRRRDVA